MHVISVMFQLVRVNPVFIGIDKAENGMTYVIFIELFVTYWTFIFYTAMMSSYLFKDVQSQGKGSNVFRKYHVIHPRLTRITGEAQYARTVLLSAQCRGCTAEMPKTFAYYFPLFQSYHLNHRSNHIES